jgi:hypothetical protein
MRDEPLLDDNDEDKIQGGVDQADDGLGTSIPDVIDLYVSVCRT